MIEFLGAFLGSALGASLACYFLIPRETEIVLEYEPEEQRPEEDPDWWKHGPKEEQD